jgi:hypothetical protein
MDLQQGSQNFNVSGNSYKFSEWVKAAYGNDCRWLPTCMTLASQNRVLCGKGGRFALGSSERLVRLRIWSVPSVRRLR